MSNFKQRPMAQRDTLGGKPSGVGGQMARTSLAHPSHAHFIDDFTPLANMPRQQNAKELMAATGVTSPGQHEAYLSEIFRQNHSNPGKNDQQIMPQKCIYPYVGERKSNKELRDDDVRQSSQFVISEEDLCRSLSPKDRGDASMNQRNSQICTLSELKEDRVLQASIGSQQTAYQLAHASYGHFQNRNGASGANSHDQLDALTGSFPNQNILTTEGSDGNNPLQTDTIVKLQVENKQNEHDTAGSQFDPLRTTTSKQYNSEIENKYLRPSSTHRQPKGGATMGRMGLHDFLEEEEDGQEADKMADQVSPQNERHLLQTLMINSISSKSSPQPVFADDQTHKQYRISNFNPLNEIDNSRDAMCMASGRLMLLQCQNSSEPNSALLQTASRMQQQSNNCGSVVANHGEARLSKSNGRNHQNIMQSYQLPTFSKEIEEMERGAGVNETQLVQNNGRITMNLSTIPVRDGEDESFVQCIDNFYDKSNEIPPDAQVISQNQNLPVDNAEFNPQKQQLISLLNSEREQEGDGQGNGSDQIQENNGNQNQDIRYKVVGPTGSENQNCIPMLFSHDKIQPGTRSTSNYLHAPSSSTPIAMSHNPSFNNLDKHQMCDPSLNPYQATQPLAFNQKRINCGSQVISCGMTAATAATASQKSVSMGQSNHTGNWQNQSSKIKFYVADDQLKDSRKASVSGATSELGLGGSCGPEYVPKSQENVHLQNQKLMKELEKLRGEITQLKQLQMDQSNFQSRIVRMVGNLSSTQTRNNLQSLSLSGIPSTQRSNSNISKQFDLGQFKSNPRADSMESKQETAVVSKQTSENMPQQLQHKSRLQTQFVKLTSDIPNVQVQIPNQQPDANQQSRFILEQIEKMKTENQKLQENVSNLVQENQVLLQKNGLQMSSLDRTGGQMPIIMDQKTLLDSSLENDPTLLLEKNKTGQSLSQTGGTQHGNNANRLSNIVGDSPFYEEIENILIHNQQFNGSQQFHDRNQSSTQPVRVQEYDDSFQNQQMVQSMGNQNDVDEFVISSQTSHLQQTPHDHNLHQISMQLSNNNMLSSVKTNNFIGYSNNCLSDQLRNSVNIPEIIQNVEPTEEFDNQTESLGQTQEINSKKSSFLMCNKLLQDQNKQQQNNMYQNQAQDMIKNSLKKNRIGTASQMQSVNFSMKSTQITSSQSNNGDGDSTLKKLNRCMISNSNRGSFFQMKNNISMEKCGPLINFSEADRALETKDLAQQAPELHLISSSNCQDEGTLTSQKGDNSHYPKPQYLGMPKDLVTKTAPSSMKVAQSRKMCSMLAVSSSRDCLKGPQGDSLAGLGMVRGPLKSSKLIRSDSFSSSKISGRAPIQRQDLGNQHLRNASLKESSEVVEVKRMREFGQEFVVLEKQGQGGEQSIQNSHSKSKLSKSVQKKPPLCISKKTSFSQRKCSQNEAYLQMGQPVHRNDFMGEFEQFSQFKNTFEEERAEPKEIKEEEHHERIRDLFKDQFIKAQSFMDLVNSKPPASRTGSFCKSLSKSKENLNNTQRKPLIRLQSTKEMNQQKANDVYHALQEFIQQMELNGYPIDIQRVTDGTKSHRSGSKVNLDKDSFLNQNNFKALSRQSSMRFVGGSCEKRSAGGGFVSSGNQGQTLDKLCQYDIMIPNIRYKQEIERKAYLEENSNSHRVANMRNLIPRNNQAKIYSIQSKMAHQQYVKQRIRLAVGSDGQLMIKTGGGFRLFSNWLAEKRVIV